MARGTEEVLSLRADMSHLFENLRKMPGITDKEAKAMVRSLERQFKRAENAAKKSAQKQSNSFDKMGKSARNTGRKLRVLGEAANTLVPGLGGVATQAGALAKGFSVLANPVGLATIAIAGVGAAAIGAVVGMVKVTQAADNYLDKYEQIQGLDEFPGIDRETINSIRQAADNMEALSGIAKQFVIILAGEFAPYVERGSLLLVKLGMVGLQAFNAFADGHDVVREFAVYMGDQFVKLLTSPIDGLVNVIGLMGDLASAVGLETISEKLTRVNERWDNWTRSVAEAGVDALFDAGAEGIKRLELSLGITDEEARAFVATLQKVETAQKKVAEAAEINWKAWDRQQKKIRESIEEMNEAAAATGDLQAELDAAFQQAMKDIQLSIASSTGQFMGGLQELVTTANDILLQETGKSSKALFLIGKSAGIAQATINTFVAATQALAMLGPIAGPIAAAAIVASGIATVAKIAATPPPKGQAHMGQIGRSTALDPAETLSPRGQRVLRSETVLDSATTARLGGESGVRDLMMGGGAGRIVVVGDRYKHLDRRVTDLIAADTRTARELARARGRTQKRSR